MDKVKEELLNWLRNHIAARDQITNEILSQEENSGGFDIYVKTKTKEQFYIVTTDLDFKRLSPMISADKHIYIIVPNTHNALTETLNHWEALKSYPKLCIMYVNPHAPFDRKWALFPATHDKLLGKTNLKTGLLSLFSGVPEYSQPNKG